MRVVLLGITTAGIGVNPEQDCRRRFSEFFTDNLSRGYSCPGHCFFGLNWMKVSRNLSWVSRIGRRRRSGVFRRGAILNLQATREVKSILLLQEIGNTELTYAVLLQNFAGFTPQKYRHRWWACNIKWAPSHHQRGINSEA